MILCDIGNTYAKFYNNGMITKMEILQFENYEPDQKIFFISVNERLKNKLENNELFVNLAPFYEFNTNYKGIGIDRIAVCKMVKNGVVIDAGSAISVDIMEDNKHLGGFLLPGISKYLQAYTNISQVLNINLNSQIDIEKLPQNTTDAVSYGIIKSTILMIKDIAKKRIIYFTGGDGQFFERFFQKSIYDKNMLFRSMLEVIKQKDIK